MQESVGDTVPRFQPHLPRRTDLLVVLHDVLRSEEHTSELQSQSNLVCRLLLEKKNRIFLMSRKIILIKQELLLLVYDLNRSGLLAEHEKIRLIIAYIYKLFICYVSSSANHSVN